MKTKDIAELLGINEAKAWSALGEDYALSSINTIKEAHAVCYSCPKDMQSAVMKKWKELFSIELASIKTAEEARYLFYNDCPNDMCSAVMKRWEELAIPSIKTVGEAKILYHNCPIGMHPAIIKAMTKL